LLDKTLDATAVSNEDVKDFLNIVSNLKNLGGTKPED
jgi:hypothetical protein